MEWVLKDKKIMFFGKRCKFIWKEKYTNFYPFKEKPTGYLAWINIYNLPIKFWTDKALWKIENAIGDFQDPDERTSENLKTRENFSKERIYICMDIFIIRKKSITLSSNWRNWVQNIYYEYFIMRFLNANK